MPNLNVSRIELLPNRADEAAQNLHEELPYIPAEHRDFDELVAAVPRDTLGDLAQFFGAASDALCRLATGGGFATRELHSNRNEVVLDAQRPIILNGIPDLAARPDLGDRAIALTLQTIPEDRRRLEAEFLGAFEEARPAILGALLDAVSSGLRNLGTTRLERLPRMADFALWVAAAEQGLGWEPGSFIRAYATNRSSAVRVIVENNAVAQAIQSLAQERDWEGSASELLPLLEIKVSETTRMHRSWPTSPSALGAWLGRLAPALRAVGVDIQPDR